MDQTSDRCHGKCYCSHHCGGIADIPIDFKACFSSGVVLEKTYSQDRHRKVTTSNALKLELLEGKPYPNFTNIQDITDLFNVCLGGLEDDVWVGYLVPPF